MRQRLAAIVCCSAMALVPVVTPAPAAAEMLSKTYEFKPDSTLEVSAEIEPGLRLDSVRFTLPSSVDGKVLRVSGYVRADVSISNTGTESRRFGIAIALFDDANRLVGVASGGVKLFPMRPNRQGTFSMIFDGVNAEAYRATKFQISVEPKL